MIELSDFKVGEYLSLPKRKTQEAGNQCFKSHYFRLNRRAQSFALDLVGPLLSNCRVFYLLQKMWRKHQRKPDKICLALHYAVCVMSVCLFSISKL